MAAGATDDPTEVTGPRRARHHVGLWVLAVAGVAAIATIAWGISSTPVAAIETAPIAAAQFTAVRRGPLVEQTRVTSTVSRGEIISLVVPTGSNSATPSSSSSSSTSASAATQRPTTSTTTTTTTTTTSTTSSTTTSTSTTTATAVPASTTTGVTSGSTTTSPPPPPPPPTVPPTTAPPTTAAPRTTAPPSAATTPASASSPIGANAAAGTGTNAGAPVVVGAGVRVVTGLAAVGTVLHAGDSAFSIDGVPTVVMAGAVPAWRAIGADTGDGEDVRQLEQNLHAAGFTDKGRLTVDGHVDAHTVAAIDAWQKSVGVEPTGVIERGEIVFLAGDATVAATATSVGAVVAAGDAVLDARTGAPFVDVSTDASWAHVGDTVRVSTGSSTLTGTVSSFASGIARVGLPDGSSIRDGASATATLSRVKVADQLLVPAAAILKDDLRGPTVSVRRGRDAPSQVTVSVEVIASASGTAAVRPLDGTLRQGESVRSY